MLSPRRCCLPSSRLLASPLPLLLRHPRGRSVRVSCRGCLLCSCQGAPGPSALPGLYGRVGGGVVSSSLVWGGCCRLCRVVVGLPLWACLCRVVDLPSRLRWVVLRIRVPSGSVGDAAAACAGLGGGLLRYRWSCPHVAVSPAVWLYLTLFSRFVNTGISNIFLPIYCVRCNKSQYIFCAFRLAKPAIYIVGLPLLSPFTAFCVSLCQRHALGAGGCGCGLWPALPPVYGLPLPPAMVCPGWWLWPVLPPVYGLPWLVAMACPAACYGLSCRLSMACPCRLLWPALPPAMACPAACYGLPWLVAMAYPAACLWPAWLRSLCAFCPYYVHTCACGALSAPLRPLPPCFSESLFPLQLGGY